MNDMIPKEPEQEAAPDSLPADAAMAGRKTRGWGRLFGVGAVLLLGAGLALGTWRYHEQQQELAAAAAQKQSLVPTLRTALVKPTDGTMKVELPGTTSAFAAANIFARASGYVDKRNVDIGDQVKAGQVLAEITAPELDHQIAQAEATLVQTEAARRQSQANADLADTTWGRDKPLVQEGWVTKQQGSIDQQTVNAQQAAVGVAEANIAAQEAQLKVLRQQKDYQSVVAPFDGVITQRNIDVGSLVQADATSGTFMFTIMQSKLIRTQVFVPQDQAFGVGPGVPAVIRIPELPGKEFPGKVTRIADALEPTTRTLLTEIDVPNPDGSLPPGVYCRVELQIPRKTPAVIVSADAVVFDAEGLHVAVVENGVVQMRKITIARDYGTEVEVSDGLKAGEQVVLNPPVNLAEGAKVNGKPEATASSNAY